MDETSFSTPTSKVGNAKKVAVIGAGIAVLAGGYFVFIRKDENGQTYWEKWTGGGAGEQLEKVDKPTEAPPVGISWTPEVFPLKKGMYGGHIKLLQQKLGISDDGKFGAGTEKSVMAKFGKPTVEISDYNSLVNPVPPIKKGETVYAKSFPIILYKAPSTSSQKYSTSKEKKVGVVVDITTVSGFKWAKIYNSALEYTVVGSGGYFYVPVQNLKNKP